MVNILNPLLPPVAILGPAWQGVVEDDVAWLATMLSHTTLNIHCSVSLLVTPSGLEYALAFQGNLSLHGTAISEPIFNYLSHSNQLKKPQKINILKAAICCGRDLN